MSEAIEQLMIHKSPLDEMQARLGAEFEMRDGWRVAASYGDAAAEYAAVRSGNGAGVIDLSSRGRIEVAGAEAVQFLNGLITNDVKTLADGAWMSAAFPNVQGRLQALVRILRRGETFLFDTEPVTHERVFKLLERFTLAGDFRVTDVTEQMAMVSLQGARAAKIIRAVFDEAAANVERNHAVASQWQSQSAIVMRATHTGEDGFDLFVDAAHAVALWDALCAAGARAVGFEALETLRIEAGIPRFGADMDETNVVLETGLDEAVSFTKGCYIGQEIIARIHWRGHVAKRLAGLMFDDEVKVGRDDKVRSVDGKEIGRVTSVARSPRLNRTIALGLVKYDYLKPLTPVRVLVDEQEIAASVIALPFVRGSWFETAERLEAQDG